MRCAYRLRFHDASQHFAYDQVQMSNCEGRHLPNERGLRERRQGGFGRANTAGIQVPVARPGLTDKEDATLALLGKSDEGDRSWNSMVHILLQMTEMGFVTLQ